MLLLWRKALLLTLLAEMEPRNIFIVTMERKPTSFVLARIDMAPSILEWTISLAVVASCAFYSQAPGVQMGVEKGRRDSTPLP